MDYENMYERYGLGGNPFQKQAKNRYKTISESHVDLALDDEIARIKKSVFKHKKTEIVFLVGKEGMGKTERVLVCQKEAEMNNFSYVSIPLSTHNGCAMKLFLDEVSPKGSALLSNDKWEREVSKLKKVVHKGYDASRVAGLLVDAFKKRVPGFLLIDDLHMVLNAVDAQLFIQALSILIKQAPPGIFILITADKKKVSGLLNVFSNLRSLFSHPLEIAPLTDENTWRIISKKIESKRMVSEISNGYPFAESSISYLNELAKGNPKKILAAANIVLTAAAFQKVYLISDEFQKETFNHLKSKPWFISSSFKVKTDLLISMENLDIVSSDKKPILQGKKEKIKPDFSGPEKKSIFKKSVKPLKSGDNGSDKNPYKSINVASELPVDKKQTVKKPVEKKSHY